ncbi:lysophospholipase L1-like esterase [Dysgonomonadaceae bacterium PH5-43]|nr:lysophospholipase L1-like esterase [Dysgonomonadaceae bacterium PH5-43]
MKRLNITLVILMLICLSSKAQRSKYDIGEIITPMHSFIKEKYNTIQVPGEDSTRLNNFFHKIDTLLCYGEGRINILHIGGSHVQADVFSHQVRKNLDNINGDFQTPRGFIFPYSIAKTNNPPNYKVSYTGVWEGERNVKRTRGVPLGVGGITVYTSDPEAQVNITLNPDSVYRWEFEQLRLIGYVEDGSCMVTPVLYYNNDTIYGQLDLSLYNTYIFELPAPDYSFSMGFIQHDTIPHTFVINGFIPEKETPGIVYHSIGINGASVPSYLKCEDFENELKNLQPDLIIFGIGINDAVPKDFKPEDFKNNYSYLLEIAERVNPDCAFIFLTNNDSFRRVARRRYLVNTNGTLARKAFFELAEKYNAGVWDLFTLMGGLNSMRKWQNAGLAQVDKIHFTRPGYVLLGDMLYNALIQYYKKLESTIEIDDYRLP